MTPSSPRALSPESLLEHHSWVRGLARSLVFDDSEADDVVQQTWLAALRSPPTQAAAVRGWLGTVVRNAARQLARGESRRAAREQQVARDERLPATAELVARAEAQRLVVDAVLQLDEPYLTTVLLRFYEDLPPREVARRLGVPVETVRARLRRAMEHLRGVLDRTGNGRRNWGLALLPLMTGPGVGATPAASSGTGSGASPGATVAGSQLVAVGTVVAAGVLAGAIGYAAARWSGPGPTPSVAPIAGVAAQEDLVREVAQRRDELAGLRSGNERTQAAVEAARADVSRLGEERAALAADVERGFVAPVASDDPSASADRAPRIVVAGYEDALAQVDWSTLGAHVRDFIEHADAIAQRVLADGAPDAGHVGGLQTANGHLVVAELSMRGVDDCTTISNQHLSHPAVAANLIATTLEAFGAPLSPAQTTALARVASERSAELAREREGRSPTAGRLAVLRAETDLRRRFGEQAFDVLNAEQSDLLSRAAVRDRAGLGLFGDNLVLSGVARRVDPPTREALVESLHAALDEPSLTPVETRAVARWAAALPSGDFGRTGDPLDLDGEPRCAMVRAWLDHTLALVEALAADPETAALARRVNDLHGVLVPLGSPER